MDTTPIAPTAALLLAELVDGAPVGGAFMLNGGDPGLLRSLDRITAADASRTHAGGASIAAHVDHLRYGLSLINRWADEGGNPFADADWTRSWHRTTVDDAGWAALRRALADETHRWHRAIERPREVMDVELAGMLGSVAHLAYHLGAIRQMDRSLRGPSADE